MHPVLAPGKAIPDIELPDHTGVVRRLREPPVNAVTTFVRDSAHFAGALTVRRNVSARLGEDPVARLHPAPLLQVGSGLLELIRPQLEPVTQRCGG